MRLALTLTLTILFGVHAKASSGPQTVKIVFFVPSDLAVPDGAQQRLTKIANTAERFLFTEMDRLGYPPANRKLFQRAADGQVELLHIRGEQTAASGKYANPTYADYVVKRASSQYHIGERGDVWWIFIYLGDRPVRFQDWQGGGAVQAGGWAMVNYDTVPGEIRPDLQLTEGFNREYFLKSTIHELAHAFGLPHVGPDPTLDLGNSLMGPNPTNYAAKKRSQRRPRLSRSFVCRHAVEAPALFRGAKGQLPISDCQTRRLQGCVQRDLRFRDDFRHRRRKPGAAQRRPD